MNNAKNYSNSVPLMEKKADPNLFGDTMYTNVGHEVAYANLINQIYGETAIGPHRDNCRREEIRVCDQQIPQLVEFD